MDEAGLIKWSRNRANRGIKAALSSPPPNRYKLEREYAQTLHLCDALEASRERELRLKAEIQRYIDAEKAAASFATDVGTTGQSAEDVGRAARVAVLASVLYLIEEGVE